MNDWPYLVIGWGVSLVALGVYASRLVARGRRLGRLVPDEDKSWT